MSEISDLFDEYTAYVFEHAKTMRAHSGFGKMYRHLRYLIDAKDRDFTTAKNELSAMREAQRWIPVNVLPDMGGSSTSGKVLVCVGQYVTTGYYSKLEGAWMYYIGGKAENVTHWRPMPEPPTEEVRNE